MAILAISAALLLMPVPAGIEPRAMHAAALVIFAIGFWATGALPEHLTALAFFAIAMLLEIAPPDTVFAGFAATAFWLVLGGLVIGVAVKRTGLGERLARLLVGRASGSYFRTIAGLALVGIALAFVMPSSLGRAVLMIPIALALADHLGFAPGSRGRTGMAMVTGLISFVPGIGVLPAAVPNMVLIGTLEATYGMTLNYGEYLLWHFPILGLLKSFFVVVLIAWMFRDEPKGQVPEMEKAKPLSRDERVLALLLMVALGLWATDMWHGVSPAWVALGVAVVSMLPGVNLVPAAAFGEKINFSSVFYVAAILGIGAVVADTGLGEVVGQKLLAVLPLEPGADGINFASLVALGSFVGMVTALPGVPAVLTPMSDALAQASGWPLTTIIMVQVVGYSTVFLPYQVPPLVVAMQMGGVRLNDGVRATLALGVLSVILIVPLNYLWWRFLGFIG
ncbi:SLC13 family permease [Telmatospirillum sp. J64-1]|uniref:SLC13 family permease n=1 Tax=Telmatospirillum sp. J64-1 TaxID=2502183 RepID=UPI00163D9BC1|nr:SLC13 family permease [Telmatospirillum sp. J64-1]